MRNFVKFSMLALVAFATTASAAELEFHGYARAGIGLNDKGGVQVAYGLSSADTKFRLGNEPDYCLEPGFEYKFTTLEDKSAWGVNFMPAFYRRFGNAKNGSGYEDLPVYFKQIYFFGNNVPQLANGQIWAGRRYIERLQTGINDQFLENEDGDGAGIENMDFGFAKGTINILMNPNGAGLDNTVKYAFHLTGIQTFSKDAALQIWTRAYVQSKVSAVTKRDPGFNLGLYHTWNLGDLGSNLVGFKLRTSGKQGTGDGSGGNARANTTWRVVFQHGITVASAKTSIDFITEYRQSKDKGQKANNWFAIGARSDTQISGPFRFLLEVGNDWTKSGASGAKAHNLTKVTGALAVSGGNDPWSRPTFRLFGTYGTWNKDANADVRGLWINGADDGTGDRLTNSYGATATSGFSYGIQAEGWW